MAQPQFLEKLKKGDFSDKKAVREHLIMLTRDLLSFSSSEALPGEKEEMIEYIQDYFCKDKVFVKVFNFNGYPSVYIAFSDAKHTHIFMNGHIDIPSGYEQVMAQVTEEKIYGLGAMDMKAGVACMMATMKYLAHLKGKKPSISLLLTSDEEIGGENGMKAFLEETEFTSDFAITGEGRDRYDIVMKEKGILLLRVIAQGQSAHGAYPWLGENAIMKLYAALKKIQALFPEGRDSWTPNCKVTMINGGKGLNVIPNQAEAILDIRLTGGRKWSSGIVLDKIRNAVPEIEIEVMVDGKEINVPEDHPYLKLLQKIAKKVTKQEVKFAYNHGASDARYLVPYNIPVAILGPTGGEHHTAKEWVDIRSIVDHFLVLREFIERTPIKGIRKG